MPKRNPVEGATANCERCQKLLRVANKRREDSKPFRLAKVPEGVCAECVMTQFLYNTYPINMQIDQAGPELLLKPGIKEAFVACGLLEKCDMDINEIDWQRLVDNWKLPVKIQKKDGRNPYRMGEAKLDRGFGFFGAKEADLPPGVRDNGGTLIVDGKRFREGRIAGSSPLSDALGGLLDAIDEGPHGKQ